ncbi:MAG TPA: hypothetical protein VII75_11235 [Thermoanaerobaculia bacterium]|nr:hypothetical protein [Thermoanaerobaculia bacterium]
MSSNQPASNDTTGIARFQLPALIIGVIGFAITIFGWISSREAALHAYLSSYLFWFQIVAGALAVLCLQYVTGGEWGILLRRPLGAAARTMIVMLVLAIPVAVGVGSIYPWTNDAFMQANEALRMKQGYLNARWWWIRGAVYFAFWILWAWRIRILSLKFYDDRSPYTDLRRRRWAASGIPMIVMTLTFCSIDWMMSLEPKWYSTMYGINFIVSAGLAAFAFCTFFLSRLATTPAMADIIKPIHFRDLGNLMLAFVMLWAYTAFSEFLLIWYGNIKEEIPHFLMRQEGGWGAVSIGLIVLHFFLPFFMLLIRDIKDRPATIGVVAVIVLVMRYIGTLWSVAPAFGHFTYTLWDIGSLLGVGGIWLYFFIGQLKGQTIIPIHETWVEEAIREGAMKVNA